MSRCYIGGDNASNVNVPRSLPFIARKKAIDYMWVVTHTFNTTDSLACLRACLVTKGYAQTYTINYPNTLSPTAKLTFVHVLISLATNSNIASSIRH